MTNKKDNKFEFDVEVGKVLNLMINSLYTNKDIALRELISNAADACDKLRYLSASKEGILSKDEELKIVLKTDKSNKKLMISDNGIGMSKQDLIKNLGTIARSGTENFVKGLSGDAKKDVELIGQFGVGFYSSFMVANKVEVISRKYDGKSAHKWVSTGTSSFEIEEYKDDFERGTKIILHLKDDITEFLDRFHIKHVVQTYSDHINFKIEFIPENLEAGAKVEVLNSASALWKRPKNEITKEQYQNFFKNISHIPGEPWMTIHNSVEGVVSYTNLLFIPESKPFDLFHPDRKTSVKLYVKKVFISEELNLVPACLRFMRGLVDSDDLPLNISRENLQHNLVLDKIRKSIVNKVLGELKKKADKDEEGFLKFWNNFGAVLKEGLCEASDFREKILDIARFYSSKSPDKLISLAQYLDGVKVGQDKIYFLSGETVAKIKSSPQLEMFNKQDVEVLFLTDAVDEFWVTVGLPYKDKNKDKSYEFVSINRGDVDLSDIDKTADQKQKEKEEKEEKGEDKTEEKDVTNSEFEGLITFFKETLGDKVSDVKISKKLTNSPVCLAVGAGSMDIRLERYLLEQKQIQSASSKILEINADNS
ncbi:MAG: molecular chaperone HtpG, partial [Rickettsiales bacterium]|nr:molecular chaperone HtpG [Rickettsiales bacterium]